MTQIVYFSSACSMLAQMLASESAVNLQGLLAQRPFARSARSAARASTRSKPTLAAV